METGESESHWSFFAIPVGRILDFLERRTGSAFPATPTGGLESNRWHLALREGLRSRLHLNLGIPGVEEPDHPIEENASALHAALLMQIPVLEVILSGEWELAVREGLITRDQLIAHEAALQQEDAALD